MAWTSVGFDGTITEIQWAGLAGLLGNGYVAAGNGDCLVTAVSGARQVSVAAGSLYGDGVLSTNSGAETVALTTPTNGQWYVIALRRTWATNTAALVAVAGATTTTTTPTAPPTSFPVLNTNVGVLTDQPIAWAWCNSANTTVVVYDIRLKAVKSLPPVVATSAERDAKFMSPTQGLQVWRDDLGAVETYYGLYNSSTNPGGRDTAGWYSNDRSGGLVPVRPTSITAVTGSATVNSLGKVSFTEVTRINLSGVFTSEYANYKIVYTLLSYSTPIDALRMRVSAGGTDNTTGDYSYGGIFINRDGGSGTVSGNSVDMWTISSWNGSYPAGGGQVDIQNPYVANVWAGFQSIGTSSYRLGTEIVSGAKANTNQFDGFSIIPGSSRISGTVQVFGYND